MPRHAYVSLVIAGNTTLVRLLAPGTLVSALLGYCVKSMKDNFNCNGAHVRMGEHPAYAPHCWLCYLWYSRALCASMA